MGTDGDWGGQITKQLECSLHPDASVRRPAEGFLASQELRPHFSLILLQLVASDSAAGHLRQAAAVYLKNVTKRLWEDFPEPDRLGIKSSIVDVLLRANPIVRKQLSEVLALAAAVEYPERWPDLAPSLVHNLTSAYSRSPPDWSSCQGILETLDALFERYRFQYRSDPLFLEIKYSLTHVHDPLLCFYQTTSASVLKGSMGTTELFIALEGVRLATSIFYSLSWQDIPEQIENNLQEWCKLYLCFLQFSCEPVERSASPTEPTVIENIQVLIVDIMEMFVTKYDEEIRPVLEEFVSAIWNLLVQRGTQSRYDELVTTGIRFLSAVCKGPYFELFARPETLQQICERLVLPNVEIRDEDRELFEDSPLDYVRREIEKSDTGSRRRSACELLSGLCVHFESSVTEAMSNYVASMLQEYSADNAKNWKLKDAAIYIVTALAWRSGTQAGGATSTSTLVNVVEFFSSQILPELTIGQNGGRSPNPMLIVDCIQYAIAFRNQLPKESLRQLLDIFVALLSNKDQVIHTYAAVWIERIFAIVDVDPQGRKTPRCTVEDVSAILVPLLQVLAHRVGPGVPENEYVMKLWLRVVTVTRSSFQPHAMGSLRHLATVVVAVSSNPGNPNFNHYLFETIAAHVRFACVVEQVHSFEEVLFPPFQTILTSDVQEFGPYVFQILSMLMECRPSVHALPPTYAGLLQPLLGAALWDRVGYIPSMVQYISGYVTRSSANISVEQLTSILGIFQKLVASKANDQHGMNLLSTIFRAVEPSRLKGGLCDAVLGVLMKRLEVAKTAKFVRLLLPFLSLLVVQLGVDSLMEGLNKLQMGLLEVLLTRVWLPEVASVTVPMERKLCALGMTTMVTSPQFMNEPYAKHRGPLLNAIIAILEGIRVDSAENEAPEDEIAEDFHVAHAQLAWNQAGRTRDLFPEVEPKFFLASKFDEASRAQPGILNQVVQTALEPAAAQLLSQYLSAAGLSLQ